MLRKHKLDFLTLAMLVFAYVWPLVGPHEPREGHVNHLPSKEASETVVVEAVRRYLEHVAIIVG